MGESVTIEAQVVDGYSFAYWENREGQFVSRQNPLTLNLFADMELVAVIDEIEKLSSPSLRIFPNPSNGLFELRSKFNETARLQVYNSFGVEVEIKFIQPHSTILDLTHLAPGLYVLEFVFENEVLTEKVVIK